jgi:hypothetical protein
MDPGISQSLLMAKHLRNRTSIDAAWLQALDKHFMAAAFENPVDDPLFNGPDRLTYFAFRAARSYDIPLIPFREALEAALHWGAGGVIYPGGGVAEWIYSPGDLVSLAVCGTSAFQWQGDWGLPPIVVEYAEGGSINIGRPNPEFLSPLASRSLECILRRVYKSQPRLQEKVPGIAVTRPAVRTRPEQASELMINASMADFESSESFESFQVLVSRFLPSHLARRLINFESQLIPDDKFTPLLELISEAELEPVPDSVHG